MGSEANCSDYLCCRPHAENSDLGTGRSQGKISQPASRYGSLYCDSPADLAISAFSNMDKFFKRDKLAFSIFTGDIVSHDDSDMLSRAYVRYSEEVTYNTFKSWLGNTPVYATLGNHDSLPVSDGE